MSDTRVHYNALDQLVQAFGDGKVDSHKGRAETFIGVFELIKARKQHWYECMAPDSREYLFQDIEFTERLFELALFAARRLNALEKKVSELEITVDLCTEPLKQ